MSPMEVFMLLQNQANGTGSLETPFHANRFNVECHGFFSERLFFFVIWIYWLKLRLSDIPCHCWHVHSPGVQCACYKVMSTSRWHILLELNVHVTMLCAGYSFYWSQMSSLFLLLDGLRVWPGMMEVEMWLETCLELIVDQKIMT